MLPYLKFLKFFFAICFFVFFLAFTSLEEATGVPSSTPQKVCDDIKDLSEPGPHSQKTFYDNVIIKTIERVFIAIAAIVIFYLNILNIRKLKRDLKNNAKEDGNRLLTVTESKEVQDLIESIKILSEDITMENINKVICNAMVADTKNKMASTATDNIRKFTKQLLDELKNLRDFPGSDLNRLLREKGKTCIDADEADEKKEGKVTTSGKVNRN